MKKVTMINGEKPIVLLCIEDEEGNLWPKDCPENRRALGWGKTGGEAFFGSCFVPVNGNERDAREKSISYYTGEGKNFIIGESPNDEIACQLNSLASRVLWDSELAEKAKQAIAGL